MNRIKTKEIAGINICSSNLKDIVDYLLFSEEQKLVSTLSMPMLGELKSNEDYKKALEESEIVLPDGVGIVILSKIIHKKNSIKKRIAGPDFFKYFNKIANEKRLKYFFMGSTENTLLKIKNKISEEWPNIIVAGTLSPPFKEWDEGTNNSIIEEINKAKPDILWIAMTAPKQEIWAAKNRDKLNVKIIASIGAAFDFYAGTKKRAPLFFQKMGLEWLYRTFQEPVRMGKRYLKGFLPFFYFLLKGLRKRIKK